MKRSFVWSSLVLPVLGVPMALCAHTSEFTIADGSITYHLMNLEEQRLGLAGGLADFFVGGPSHTFQNWWWYRSHLDSREYALGGTPSSHTQIFGQVTAPNSARLIYSEPIHDGQLQDALLFDFEYTVSDLFPDSQKPDLGILVIAFKVRNQSDHTIPVSLFGYFDFDVNTDFLDDVAVISGVSNHIQHIADIPQGTQNPADAVVLASSTGLSGWQISEFAEILADLADDNINNLTNSGSPFGPGDYTGAFQWSFELEPGGEFVGSLTKIVNVVPEPGTFLALGAGLAFLLARRRRA
ncbi:MAG: PEP-CTERM sorting domain-containing protein [Candidatus Caldarchaeum sp.]